MPSNHLILCHPLLLPPWIFPSIRVFSNASVLCIRRPKYWSFSFSISPSNEYSGLISLRIDCSDLCAIQGTLKSLFQCHNSKASILQHSAFLMVQLSRLYKSKKVGKKKILYLLDIYINIYIYIYISFALKFQQMFSHLISLGFSVNKLGKITLSFKGILLTCQNI